MSVFFAGSSGQLVFSQRKSAVSDVRNQFNTKRINCKQVETTTNFKPRSNETKAPIPESKSTKVHRTGKKINELRASRYEPIMSDASRRHNRTKMTAKATVAAYLESAKQLSWPRANETG